MSTTTTTNMLLVLPTPSVRTGPQYAADINQALTDIDAHDHSDGKGVRVTPAGLDITSDLDMQGNNLTDVRSVRFESQAVVLNGINDVGAISNVNGDLYWNNNAGVQVPITSGGSLNTGGLITNVWTPTTITANLTILGSDTFTCIAVNSSSAINVNLPAANAVSAGRYYVIQDISGNSITYNISLTPNGSDTINASSGAKTLASNYGTWIVRSNGSNGWQLTYTGHAGLTSAGLTVGTMTLSASSINFAGASSLSASQLVVASAAVINSTLFTLGDVGVFASGAIQIGGDAATLGAIRLESGDPAGAIYGIGTGGNDARIIAIDNSAQILIGDASTGGSILPQNNIATTYDIEVTDPTKIVFATAQSRTVCAPISPWGVTAVAGAASAQAAGLGGTQFIIDTGNRIRMSQVDVYFDAANTANTNQWGMIFDLTPYMHDGAVLGWADLHVAPDVHASLPQSMPAWGIFRRDIMGNTADNLLSGSTGLAVDTSANTTAYNSAHVIEFTPNQHMTIDKEDYVYYGVIFDEGGTNAATCQFIGVRLHFTTINDISWA